MPHRIFRDREAAGEELAKKLALLDVAKPAVFALPRGGVPIGYCVARTLHASLDTVISRKISAAEMLELALGAIAPGDIILLNEKIIENYGFSQNVIDEALMREKEELERRMSSYRSGSFVRPHRFKTAIVVDDGMATGMTAAAAIGSVRLLQKPERIIFAAPVASEESIALIKPIVDDVVVLLEPEYFLTVGQWYERFNPVSDDEVLYYLHKMNDVFTGLVHTPLPSRQR